MCTAINFLNQQHENVFGRTMDFHYILDPRLAAFPAGSIWENTLGRELTDRYAVAGISRHFKNLYVLFDGVNEKGLAGGALYFKGYADFPPFSQQSSNAQVPALDFLHYVLGLCASLDDLRELLADITLVGLPDKLPERASCPVATHRPPVSSGPRSRSSIWCSRRPCRRPSWRAFTSWRASPCPTVW